MLNKFNILSQIKGSLLNVIFKSIISVEGWPLWLLAPRTKKSSHATAIICTCVKNNKILSHVLAWTNNGSNSSVNKYIHLRFYGHSVSTRELFLSFCLSTLCTYSLIAYSELITFLCINLIWFIYCIIITNYYYIYYCSDSFCTVYSFIHSSIHGQAIYSRHPIGYEI